jgi:LemA protein
MPGIIVVVVIVLLPVFYVIGMYNVMVRLRQHCRESWSGIDTELQRRYDLIPNLVETVKGYAAHERQTFDAVTRARTQAMASTGSPEHQAADENMLVDSLKHLMAVSEGYPELKASKNFLFLQKKLVNTEDRIQGARRFYNANVRDLNTRVEVFPSCLVAQIAKITKEEFFEIADSSVTMVPQLNL